MLGVAGRPERRVPAIIVAGTNGKGSTSAVLASILTSAGLRTGLYTSPHLVRIEERWRIDGSDLNSSVLDRAIERLAKIARKSGVLPTYFEALTMLAFIVFADAGCDVAVLEVGMGGRLDATNVVRPVASLITPVSLDHMEYLGTTIRAVAREKAGVIHRGSIVLTSNTDPAAVDVIGRRASGIGAAGLFVTPEETTTTVPRIVAGRSRFRLETPRASYPADTSLLGSHQVANVSLAVRAAEELASVFPAIDRRAIIAGIRRVVWRGRLERFVVEGREVWVDGAHNPAGAEILGGFVRKHIPSPRTLVLGILADKDARGIVAAIAPSFDEIVVTSPTSERALSTSELRGIVSDVAPKVRIRSRGRVRGAMRVALEKAPSGAIVVCGSLYVAGEAVATLDEWGGRAVAD